MTLAGEVFDEKHVTDAKRPCLSIPRGDLPGASQDCENLSCRCRVRDGPAPISAGPHHGDTSRRADPCQSGWFGRRRLHESIEGNLGIREARRAIRIGIQPRIREVRHQHVPSTRRLTVDGQHRPPIERHSAEIRKVEYWRYPRHGRTSAATAAWSRLRATAAWSRLRATAAWSRCAATARWSRCAATAPCHGRRSPLESPTGCQTAISIVRAGGPGTSCAPAWRG